MDRRRLEERLSTVRVTGGSIRGVRVGRSRVWRGIPYAAPPTGALRFRSPTAVAPWLGVRDASAYGRISAQVVRSGLGTRSAVSGGEDCLTANVRAPILGARESGPLPVTVFIHGGGYNSGSSRDFSGQGESFVDSRRVVYVSFNYRLGALGLSRLQPLLDSGASLRQQPGPARPAGPAALGAGQHRGVRRRSAQRHGLRGIGGGNAVTTLMATPSARGLFARAIAQSVRHRMPSTPRPARRNGPVSSSTCSAR